MTETFEVEPQPQSTMKRLARPILIATVVLAAGAFMLGRKAWSSDPPVAPVTETPSQTDVNAWSAIKVAKPLPPVARWTDPIPARIAFDETKASRLGSPLAGRVTVVFVERGQQVKTGAPLFAVASGDLAGMRNDLARALLQRTTAVTNLERVQALVETNSLPGKELIAAKQSLDEANLAVQLAQHKLASIKVGGQGDTAFTVTAPRDGIVVERTLAVGQPVDPSNGSLVAIADLSTVWVVGDVFEGDIGKLVPGAKAKVVVDGVTELEGTIDQVSAIVDPDRHTVPVRVQLPNPAGVLRPNASARMSLLDSTAAALSLPSSAVLSDGTTSYIYVKDPATGALKRRDIKTGPPNGGVIAVLEGVSADDQVVTQGGVLLDNQVQAN
jgi:RND family efflux transporter MFP subunit